MKIIKAIARIFKKENEVDFYYESRLNEMISDIEGGRGIDVDRDDSLLIEEMIEEGYRSDSFDKFIKLKK